MYSVLHYCIANIEKLKNTWRCISLTYGVAYSPLSTAPYIYYQVYNQLSQFLVWPTGVTLGGGPAVTCLDDNSGTAASLRIGFSLVDRAGELNLKEFMSTVWGSTRETPLANCIVSSLRGPEGAVPSFLGDGLFNQTASSVFPWTLHGWSLRVDSGFCEVAANSLCCLLYLCSSLGSLTGFLELGFV